MICKSGLRSLMAAALVWTGLAVSASAQITTGTLSGTVKDAQGGVIPGATVVLISETQADQVGAGRHQRNRRLHVSERDARTPTPSK